MLTLTTLKARDAARAAYSEAYVARAAYVQPDNSPAAIIRSCALEAACNAAHAWHVAAERIAADPTRDDAATAAMTATLLERVNDALMHAAAAAAVGTAANPTHRHADRASDEATAALTSYLDVKYR